MTVKVRFAPSPTGRLHIGNLRPALLNWLFARRQGGQFLLRIDDTDRERSKPELAEAIKTDLTWLGLTWDESANQSDRFARYAVVVAQLKAAGRLYPAYETADELDRRRKRQLAMGKPPVYDRAALKLTAAERAKLEAEGRKPHWRFRLSDVNSVEWSDGIRGPQHVDLASLSDPVLVKEDGSYLYTLASVIDDIDFAISHVIRGEDHVTNTGVQIDIFHALGTPPPAFAHHSLLVGADGETLSKRLGSLSLGSFREAGFEPMAVTSYVAAIGSSDPVEPVATMAGLAGRFDLAKLSRAPARFDEKELADLNAKLLHGLAFADVAGRLKTVCPQAGEKLWLATRGNLRVLADIAHWHGIVSGNLKPVIEDAAFAKAAAALMPQEPWDEATWPAWTGAVKAATGRKGRELFHPLRLALTAAETGPEMKALLPLIGRARAAKRLAGETG
jgi:glutamyl-tRNA synthetase